MALWPRRDRVDERRRIGEELVHDSCGVPPTAPYRPANGSTPVGEKCGMTQRKLKSVTRQSDREDVKPEQPASPPDGVPDPETADRERDLLLRRGSEQRATTENGTSRSSSRNQMAKRMSGTAIETG